VKLGKTLCPSCKSF